MNNSYMIVTDSCSDLTLKMVTDMKIDVVPLSVEIEGAFFKHYPDEREMSVKGFYDQLRDKKVAVTSLVNVGAYLEFFEEKLLQGKDILYIAFSSALSGSYQSSVIASKELNEKYPERKIIVVDSLSASMGQALLIWYAYSKQKEGLSIEDVAQWVEANKLNLCHLFTVDDLGTLRRGGRLSGAQALLGSLLKVKPVLHVTDEGKLVPIKKARGRKTSLQTIVDLMKDTIQDSKKQTIFISHGDDIEDAKYVGKLIEEQIGVKHIEYGFIGPVIGAHSGPRTIAVFFMGKQR
ncbi:MAG: DegV family protein [Acholeplasmataceae bacterium]|nr:DegV family protein [Acholeplasmataceae bacterium]